MEIKMGTRLVIKGGANFSQNAIEKTSQIVLYQGYATKGIGQKQAVVIGWSSSASEIRVRTQEIIGSYFISLNSGYVIRTIVEYTPSVPDIDEYKEVEEYNNIVTQATIIVNSSDNLSAYTYSGSLCTIITVCKTDSTQTILPTEDIIKEFYYIE